MMESIGFDLCRRLLLLGYVLMTTSVDKGDFVYSAAASDWPLNPTEEYVTAWINLTYMDAEKLHTEKTDIGKFGAGKVGPANGVVIHIASSLRNNSHYGCDFPYGNHIPNEPWIALVKRGNCTVEEKLRNAYRSNASALVVYAREDKDTLDRMTFKDCNQCNIPTVFTYRWKGEEIAKYVDQGTRVYMYITVGETIARPYTGINRTSVLFVSISFIVLMIISLAWLVFYYVQRFRYLHAKDRLAQRLCNAAKKALAKIPTRNIKLTDKEVTTDGECCAICIELYRSGETLRTLPCRHEFHKSCVDPWLLEHRTCPMCKADILKYYGFIFTGSQESILHLDMEEGVLNSSESREIESPTHEPPQSIQIGTAGHSNTGSSTTTTAIRESLHHHHHPHHQPFLLESELTPSLVSLSIEGSKGGGRLELKSSPDITHSSRDDPPSEKSSGGDDEESSHDIDPVVGGGGQDDSNSYPKQSSSSSSSTSSPSSSTTTHDSHRCVPVTVHQFSSNSDSLDEEPPTAQLDKYESHPSHPIQSENDLQHSSKNTDPLTSPMTIMSLQV